MQQALSYFRLRLIIHMRRIIVLENAQLPAARGVRRLVACGRGGFRRKKTPALSINLIEVPFSDHNNQLTTRLIAGNPPDLAQTFRLGSSNKTSPMRVCWSRLMTTWPSIDWNEADFIPGQQGQMRRDGQQSTVQLLLGYRLWPFLQPRHGF